ncbi:hypothetical protein P692DRAFT_20833853 [Suillus brevipes Sb2]|nr:hypothetical protein P692DRAFT_20833853 [Suillus brevipes Sb2]
MVAPSIKSHKSRTSFSCTSIKFYASMELSGAIWSHHHSIELHQRAGIMKLNPKTKPNERLSSFIANASPSLTTSLPRLNVGAYSDARTLFAHSTFTLHCATVH